MWRVDVIHLGVQSTMARLREGEDHLGEALCATSNNGGIRVEGRGMGYVGRL